LSDTANVPGPSGSSGEGKGGPSETGLPINTASGGPPGVWNDDDLRKRLADLSDYTIENRLGQGGMGAVYKARQRKLDRVVAIKVLPPHLSQEPSYAARLHREALALAKIQHTNVVTCFDVGECSGVFYVILEYVEGESLYDLITRRGKIPWTEALSYIRQAVMGLDHANAQGVLHRDIKPENLLLAKSVAGSTAQGPAQTRLLKIADLGLAAAAPNQGMENTRLTMDGSAVGTPHYMSPEQTLGERNLDLRSDMYALGVTLYHLLTGHPPFQDSPLTALLLKKLNETIPDPSIETDGLPPGLMVLIQRMTARAKEDRYATYGDLLRDLERVEAGKLPLAQPLPQERSSLLLSQKTQQNLTALGLPIPKYKRPQKSPLLAIVIIAAVLLAATGAYLAFRNKGEAQNSSTPAATPAAPSAPPTPGPSITPALPPTPPPPEPKTFEMTDLALPGEFAKWSALQGNLSYNEDSSALLLTIPAKDYGFAEHALPAREFQLQIQAAADVAASAVEIHVGFTRNQYFAFGFQPNQNSYLPFVHIRNLANNSPKEIFQGMAIESRNEYQSLRVRVTKNLATFLFNGAKVKELPLDTDAMQLFMRIAVFNGGANFRNVIVAPIVETH